MVLRSIYPLQQEVQMFGTSLQVAWKVKSTQSLHPSEKVETHPKPPSLLGAPESPALVPAGPSGAE